MKKIYNASVFYAVLGLASGLFYREYTKAQDFTGFTQLSLLHTHLLALGFLVMLIVLLLENNFQLTKSKWFKPFFWTYNIGLVLSVAMMTVIGVGHVAGESASAALSGISGLGHIGLTIGIGFLLTALGSQVKRSK